MISSDSNFLGYTDSILGIGRKTRHESVNVNKREMTIENRASEIIKNVIEDASNQRKNDGHVCV